MFWYVLDCFFLYFLFWGETVFKKQNTLSNKSKKSWYFFEKIENAKKSKKALIFLQSNKKQIKKSKKVFKKHRTYFKQTNKSEYFFKQIEQILTNRNSPTNNNKHTTNKSKHRQQVKQNKKVEQNMSKQIKKKPSISSNNLKHYSNIFNKIPNISSNKNEKTKQTVRTKFSKKQKSSASKQSEYFFKKVENK